MESVSPIVFGGAVALGLVAAWSLGAFYYRQWQRRMFWHAEALSVMAVGSLKVAAKMREMSESSLVFSFGLKIAVAKLRGDHALARRLERDRRDAIGQQIADSRLDAAQELHRTLDGAAWMAGRLTTVTAGELADWPIRATGEAEEALALIQEARIHAEKLVDLAKEVALREDGPAPIAFPVPDEPLSVLPASISGGGQP